MCQLGSVPNLLPPSQVYMQERLDVSFTDDLTLLGYTLHQDEVRPGLPLEVTFYWQSDAVLDDLYYPVVELVNSAVTESWSQSDTWYLGNLFAQVLHPDRYASNYHQLYLNTTPSENTTLVSVRLFERHTNVPVPLPDGSERYVLDVPIAVSE